jgi:hypothetical protein
LVTPRRTSSRAPRCVAHRARRWTCRRRHARRAHHDQHRPDRRHLRRRRWPATRLRLRSKSCKLARWPAPALMMSDCVLEHLVQRGQRAVSTVGAGKLMGMVSVADARYLDHDAWLLLGVVSRTDVMRYLPSAMVPRRWQPSPDGDDRAKRRQAPSHGQPTSGTRARTSRPGSRCQPMHSTVLRTARLVGPCASLLDVRARGLLLRLAYHSGNQALHRSLRTTRSMQSFELGEDRGWCNAEELMFEPTPTQRVSR